MPQSFFARRKILKNINSLDLVPIALVEHEILENNKVKLIIPRFSKFWLEKIFTGKKISRTFRISLDETGSQVWLLIDGVKNVADIVAQQEAIFASNNQKIDGIAERTSGFISRLYQEEYITFKQLEH
jgi:hypothetical protein